MTEHSIKSAYDVVVIGSGTSGMVSALRAHDLGLDVVVLEKSDRFGGTSAMSGGVMWVPANSLMKIEDDRASALRYIDQTLGTQVDRNLYEAYLDHAPLMVEYLRSIGISLRPITDIPDYYEAADSKTGRSIGPVPMDAATLGDELVRLRLPHPLWQLFNRYSMDQVELGTLGLRLPGWMSIFCQITLRYWLDIPWRMKTKRDRRLTLGNALIGGLRVAMMKRGIPLILNCNLSQLEVEYGDVRGVEVEHNGTVTFVEAREAVVVAAGGFDHDKALRGKYLPFVASDDTSLTPHENNGDAMRAAMALGADTALMDQGFWVQGMKVPKVSDLAEVTYHIAFRNPHSICVNHLGVRFGDESSSYDTFGNSMMDNLIQYGDDACCWMIFDAQFREKYACGALFPTSLMPDRKVPTSWWDTYVWRADTIAALATKICVDSTILGDTVLRSNGFAASGFDSDFNRGQSAFDQVMGGDPRVSPNPSLAAVEQAPFYAVPLYLCDLGTKGGIRVDTNGQAVDSSGKPIPGLYVVGVTAAALFGNGYPGAGASIGPSNAFAYAAANDIAVKQRRNSQVGNASARNPV